MSMFGELHYIFGHPWTGRAFGRFRNQSRTDETTRFIDGATTQKANMTRIGDRVCIECRHEASEGVVMQAGCDHK